jgi:acyl-CoA dehydrogenase
VLRVACVEPAVASSDATNIQTEIRRDGQDFVISGRKYVFFFKHFIAFFSRRIFSTLEFMTIICYYFFRWWISGVGDPRCKIMILMGRIVIYISVFCERISQNKSVLLMMMIS